VRERSSRAGQIRECVRERSSQPGQIGECVRLSTQDTESTRIRNRRQECSNREKQHIREKRQMIGKEKERERHAESKAETINENPIFKK